MDSNAPDPKPRVEWDPVLGMEITRLSPEYLEWLNGQFDEKTVMEGLREVLETGGHTLAEFLPELERLAHGDE